MAPKNRAFSEEYREQCFIAWVGAGSPEAIRKNMQIFPDENGRKPAHYAILQWMEKYDWRGRSEEIQAKAIELANSQIINLKANILRKQFEDSVLIADRALQHLVSGTFDSSASAVSAYFRSTEEQRRAVGISEIIEKMTKMSDAEVEKEILERIRRASDAGQIIDGDIKGDEDESEPDL